MTVAVITRVSYAAANRRPRNVYGTYASEVVFDAKDVISFNDPNVRTLVRLPWRADLIAGAAR